MKKIYKIITDEIIQKLEKVNASDFEKPWFNIGISPYNAISKKTYRGLNYLTLGGTDYRSKAYASFKQWKEKECCVKKGEKSHLAVFWKFSEYEDQSTEEVKKSVMVRFIIVFLIQSRLKAIMRVKLNKKNVPN